jgi:hypothetical protein
VLAHDPRYAAPQLKATLDGQTRSQWTRDGTFGEPSFFASAWGGYSLFEMVLDDADGDGRLDVIVIDED